MSQKIILSAIVAWVIVWGQLVSGPDAKAHCQIPCGIYDDSARVASMMEDAATIAKAVRLINELSTADDPQSSNQIVRWVINKEQHAQNIIDTISDYFLTQRIKSSQKDYVIRLIKHHGVIVAAMKAKQNAEEEYVTALQDRIKALAHYYPKHEH